MTLRTFAPPVWPTESTDKPEIKLLEAEFGDGYTQAVGDGMNHIRRIFALQWDVLTPEQASQIEQFLTEHGGFQPFLWTPSGDPRPLKWTCKEWDRKRATPNEMTATFRQSFLLI
jgi:phage-related protein